MKPTAVIASSPTLRRRYQDLLRSEWGEHDVDHTAALVRAVIETGTGPIQFDWEEKRSTRRKAYPVPATASEDLKEFLERANTGLIDGATPERVGARGARSIRLSRLSTQISTYATVQMHFNIGGDGGFLRDCQSLMMLVCTQFFLPRLVDAGLWDERRLVARAFLWNIQTVWMDAPAHHYHLASILLDALGSRKEARVMLQASLASTAPSDHDFITKVQMYWSSLIEDGEIEEAKRFLLDLYRRALPSDLPELEEILDLTYQRLRLAGRAA